jgi:nucleotide-binding universal stress UspA family protein
MSASEEARLIVVGTDGSESADRAVAFAADEARRWGASVRIVTAWHIPATVYSAAYAPMVSPTVEESAQNGAENVARTAAERLREQGLEVEAKVCHDQAADALIEAAKDADLLVVGSRGHGGFTGLLLGSVGQQCAHHASCPTVIVR